MSGINNQSKNYLLCLCIIRNAIVSSKLLEAKVSEILLFLLSGLFFVENIYDKYKFRLLLRIPAAVVSEPYKYTIGY